MIKNRRGFQVAALVAALSMPTASLSGCGLTIAQDVQIGMGVASAVQMIVTAVKGWEQDYFSHNPNADKQAQIDKLINDTLAADGLAQHAIVTYRDFNDRNVQQAFADLQTDYEDLMALMKDLGVVTVPTGSNLMTAERLAGRLYVLSPDAIIPKGMDAAKVREMVKAKRAARALTGESAAAACHGWAVPSVMTPGSGKPPEDPSLLGACASGPMLTASRCREPVVFWSAKSRLSETP